MENQISRFHVLNTRLEAEDAIRALNDASFDARTISLIGKGYGNDEHLVDVYPDGDRTKFWAEIWDLLPPPSSFVLPGMGLVAVTGPFTTTLACAIEASLARGGVGVLAAALADVGASKEAVRMFERALDADQYLLVVHGEPIDVAKAWAVIAGSSNSAAA